MADDKLIFGELNEKGGIKTNVYVCAISGQPIEPGDMMVTIPGTRRFYRVKAPLAWRLNEGIEEEAITVKEELEARAQSMDAPVTPVLGSPPITPDDLPFEPPAKKGKQ